MKLSINLFAEIIIVLVLMLATIAQSIHVAEVMNKQPADVKARVLQQFKKYETNNPN